MGPRWGKISACHCPKPPLAAPTKPPRHADLKIDTEAESQANSVLLFKGIFYALIGISVLLAPDFITAPRWHDIAAKASVAGWFAVVLGGAFVALYVKRHLVALSKR